MVDKNVISEEVNVAINKEKAYKQLIRVKTAEQIKLESGKWEWINIDSKTKVLRKIK